MAKLGVHSLAQSHVCVRVCVASPTLPSDLFKIRHGPKRLIPAEEHPQGPVSAGSPHSPSQERAPDPLPRACGCAGVVDNELHM